MTRVPAITCALALLAVAPAVAQTRQSTPPAHRLFVEGSLFSDRDADFTGTATMAPGVGLSVGAFLSARMSVGFEAQLPGPHQHVWQRPFDYFDPNTGRVIKGPVTSRTTIHTTSYSGLVGFHAAPDRRVRLAFVVGLGATGMSNRISNATQETGRVVSEGESTEWATAVTFGVDGQIALTPRVAIVPQFRAHLQFASSDFGKFLVRPGISIRWRF